MKRNDAEQIGKLIRSFLRQESLESPLNEQRLLDAWPEILGPAATYTSNLYIRNQTLYVHLTSAALRQELMMGREVLVRTLNQKVGAYRYYKYYFSLMVIIISMQMSKDSAGTSSTNWNGKQIPAL